MQNIAIQNLTPPPVNVHIIWACSNQEKQLISHVAEKIIALFQKNKYPFYFDLLDVKMYLTACHLNGCPLRLEDMLTSKDEDSLLHDIMGIARHMDKHTGTLQNCFFPHYSK